MVQFYVLMTIHFKIYSNQQVWNSCFNTWGSLYKISCLQLMKIQEATQCKYGCRKSQYKQCTLYMYSWIRKN